MKDLAELKASVGKTYHTVNKFIVTQQLVNEFAEATKDYQWIHTDPERARRESPFGAPVAHGFYSLSLIPKFISDMFTVERARMGVNYGLNKVRFPNAVPVGSALSCAATIASVEDHPMGGVKIVWDCVVSIEGQEKPACVAEMISLLFE